MLLYVANSSICFGCFVTQLGIVRVLLGKTIVEWQDLLEHRGRLDRHVNVIDALHARQLFILFRGQRFLIQR